jgi:16S rRNA (cytosine967-C5)-methyltransferase
LRLRPGKEISVQHKLSKAQVPFQLKNARCIAVAPATKLDEILEINREVVVQDLNSQKVIEPLIKLVNEKKEIKTAWDSCAASGGKSILLYDALPHVQLTVSDIRESILINLTKRFSEAGITGYKKIVTDIAAKALKSGEKFDLIICDAPCSGSGTWSRTPEQLYFFGEVRIEYYSALQKRIVTNAAKNLHKGSYFLYITCSVFKNENEEVASFIEEQLSLKLLHLEYFVGYNQKADTLFTALFVL